MHTRQWQLGGFQDIHVPGATLTLACVLCNANGTLCCALASDNASHIEKHAPEHHQQQQRSVTHLAPPAGWQQQKAAVEGNSLLELHTVIFRAVAPTPTVMQLHVFRVVEQGKQEGEAWDHSRCWQQRGAVGG